jgi:hypothetical protein
MACLVRSVGRPADGGALVQDKYRPAGGKPVVLLVLVPTDEYAVRDEERGSGFKLNAKDGEDVN